VNDSSVQSKVPSLSISLFKDIFHLARNQSLLPAKNMLAPWLASALLILEIFISLADEPPNVDLDDAVEDVKGKDDVNMNKVSISDSDRSALMDFALEVLERDPSNKDVSVALFRILVQKNGLSILLNIQNTCPRISSTSGLFHNAPAPYC
jgi:hypothetical protein